MKTEHIVLHLTQYQRDYLARTAAPLCLTATGLIMRALVDWLDTHASGWPSDDEA